MRIFGVLRTKLFLATLPPYVGLFVRFVQNMRIFFLQRSLKGFNFTKDIPLNGISEKLKILLKKVKGGQFY